MTVWHRVSNQFNYVSAPGDHVSDPGPPRSAPVLPNTHG